jgi:hypothetical protein
MGLFLLHLAVGALFGAWFVLSVINQFSFRWFDRVKAFDYFSLIPYWTFFAPNPGQTDYHLVYRDRLPNGSTTPWCEVALTEPRGPVAFIWNPRKRPKKVLADVAMSIARLVRTDPSVEPLVIVSFQYLLILNYLMRSLPAPAGIQRQFAIVETAGYFRDGPPAVVLRSDFHSTGRGPSPRAKEQVPA